MQWHINVHLISKQNSTTKW